MTEEQKVARAKELKAQGRSLREIGADIGCCRTTASALLQRGGPACERCGATLREPAPEGRCGFCKLEAIEALGAPSPTSTFALWELRECGHPAEQVVAALRRRQGGAAIEDVAAELGVPA